MNKQEQFNHDYLFVRKELIAGKFELKDVKLWLKSRQQAMADDMISANKQFQKLMKRRIEHNADRELESIRKALPDGDDDKDE